MPPANPGRTVATAPVLVQRLRRAARTQPARPSVGSRGGLEQTRTQPACPREVATMVCMLGEFVSETFDYDSGRQVTAYVPPNPPEAVVFTGDGELLSQWGADLEAADVPPTLIVGV